MNTRTALLLFIGICPFGIISAIEFGSKRFSGKKQCTIYKDPIRYADPEAGNINSCGLNYPIDFRYVCIGQYENTLHTTGIVDNKSHSGYGTLFRAINVKNVDSSNNDYVSDSLDFTFKLTSHNRLTTPDAGVSYPFIFLDSPRFNQARYTCVDDIFADMEIHPEYFSDLKWKHHSEDPYLVSNTVNCPGVDRTNMKECGTDGKPACLMYWPIAYQEQCNRCYKATFRLDFPIWEFAMHGRGINVDLDMRFAGSIADSDTATEPGKWFNLPQNFIIAIAKKCPKICGSGDSMTCSYNAEDTCSGSTIDFESALSNDNANSLANLIHKNLYVREVFCETREDGNLCVNKLAANPTAYRSPDIEFDFFTGIPKCDCSLGYVWNINTNVCETSCPSDSNQCDSGTLQNAHTTSECTPDATPLGYKCKCAAGYAWHSPTGQCIQVCDDNCRNNNSCFCVEVCSDGCNDPKLECVEDLQGSRSCACLPNFTQAVSGGKCVPFQLCYPGCGTNEVCGSDENGSNCTCAEGYTRLRNGHGMCVSSS